MGRATLAYRRGKPGRELAPEAVIDFLEGKVAKWQLPDDVVFLPEMPHGATGKVREDAAEGDVQGPPPAHGVGPLLRWRGQRRLGALPANR